MRIAVVGTIVADTIEHADGSVTESLGGIAHSLTALSMLAGAAHEIVPVCRVGADCRRQVSDLADALPGVTLEAVLFDDRPNPRVRLSYAEAQAPEERVERLAHALPPLTAVEVGAAHDAELALINMISGADCTPAALQRIRRGCRRVYLDVHSLALGSRPDGRRFYRTLDDFPAWLACADVVQCNRAEAAAVCGVDSRGSAAALAERLAQRLSTRGLPADAPAGGPSVGLLTLGSGGAIVVELGGGSTEQTAVRAPSITMVDPTGAGDAFGAGYVSAWLAGDPPVAAVRQAVRCGSAACRVAGLPTPFGLRRAFDGLGAVEDRSDAADGPSGRGPAPIGA